MRKTLFFLPFLLALTLIWPERSFGQAIQTIKVAKGQTADVWYGANVAGKLHLAVRTRDGRNKMNMWWITWGVGSTTSLGEWGPNGDIDIPITWWKGVVSAKLRGTAAEDTVIYLSEKSQVDKSFTFVW
jgi:hypothetical protein